MWRRARRRKRWSSAAGSRGGACAAPCVPTRSEYNRRAAARRGRTSGEDWRWRSRALGSDSEGELLRTARDFGDRALADVLDAVDLFQLGGHLVYRGGGVDRPL